MKWVNVCLNPEGSIFDDVSSIIMAIASFAIARSVSHKYFRLLLIFYLNSLLQCAVAGSCMPETLGRTDSIVDVFRRIVVGN